MDDIPEKKISPDQHIPTRHFLFNFMDYFPFGSLCFFFFLSTNETEEDEECLREKMRDRDPRVVSQKYTENNNNNPITLKQAQIFTKFIF